MAGPNIYDGHFSDGVLNDLGGGMRLFEQMRQYERYNVDESDVFQKEVETKAFNLFADVGLLLPFSPDLFVIRYDDRSFFHFVYDRCMGAKFLLDMRKADFDGFIVYVAKQCFYLGCLAAGQKELNRKSLAELSDEETETLLEAIFNRSSSNIYLEDKSKSFVRKLESATSNVALSMLPLYREALKDDDKLILFMHSFYRIGRTFGVQHHYDLKSKRK